MKLLWTPIVVAAVVTLAGCEQSSLVGPSAETSALPNTLEGPLAVQTGNGAPSGGHVYSSISSVFQRTSRRLTTSADTTGNVSHRIFVLLNTGTTAATSADGGGLPGPGR